MSEATKNTKNEKPEIVGLWLTLLLAFSVMGGSMTKWIDQYGPLVGILLGIASGAVVLVIGVAGGYMVGRRSKNGE
jgi:hypothetical protein